MSILPSFAVQAASQSVNLSNVVDTPREYEIDFSTGQLTGKIVEGKEAVKVWVWCCLKTERLRHAIYSWDYGASLEQYIGDTYDSEYMETAVEAEIREALLINPYITGIRDFSLAFDGSRLEISMTVETRFGNTEVNEIV